MKDLLWATVFHLGIRWGQTLCRDAAFPPGA